MPISEQMLKDRLKYIGASDVPALFGEDHFKNLADVVAVRIFDTIPKDAGEAARVGNFLELAIIPYLADHLGLSMDDVETDKYVIHEQGLLAANLDGWVEALRLVMEAKSTSMSSKWGEAGSDQVPDGVLLQLHSQMMCCATRDGLAGVALSRYGRLHLQAHNIEYSDSIANAIWEKVEWISEYIKRGELPPDEVPGLPTLRSIIPRKKRTTIEVQVVVEFDDMREHYLDAKKALDSAKAALLGQMPDHELADWGDEEREVCASMGKPRTTLGTSPAHDQERCDSCGVGKKTGRPSRSLRTRKRKE